MSSANVTVSRFDALHSISIRPLIMMFHRVGPETDPCGRPLVTRLELTASPSLMLALRSCRKSFCVHIGVLATLLFSYPSHVSPLFI
jgi:hypothetical protein